MRRALASIATDEVDDAVRALRQLFFHARTHRYWLPHDVSDHTLRSLYEAVKLAPTSSNCSPGRFVFVRSRGAKARLLACVSPHDVESTRAAPVTAIIAQDLRFYQRLPKLFPVRDLAKSFAGNAHFIGETAFRNSTLQGAYLVMAARALGLDCSIVSEFDRPKLDVEFFTDGVWTSNFLVNLGYGDSAKLSPRLPRLSFEEACRIV